MSNKAVYDFVDPPDVKPPEKAKVWTQLLYCDMTGWYPLPENEKMEPKPTRFEDGRLLFLDPVDTAPPDITKMVSGEYDLKTWAKGECVVSTEAEKSVYIKLPNVNSILSYHSSTRFPTFQRSWKPIVFTVSPTVTTIRLTEDLALVLTRENEQSTTVSIYAIDYNSGFCCSHPCAPYGVAYGGYVVKTLTNCLEIPRIDSTKGPWGFYIQFYKWGGLVIPKEVELTRPGSIFGSLTGGHKGDKFGTVFHPPNMFLHLHLDAPFKTVRTLTHGKDFVVTAKKESDTDINIFLLMDGQLVVYNYSFDIRINKAGGSKVNHMLKFKATIEKEEKIKQNPKFTFKPTKDMTVPVPSGSPTTELNYLISEQVVAVFDAEISQYSTHPPGMKLCDSLKKLAMPAAN